MNLDSILRAELDALEEACLRRTLRPTDGTRLLNFAANDYLGLSRHPALIEAAREATAQRGAGACTSRAARSRLPRSCPWVPTVR